MFVIYNLSGLLTIILAAVFGFMFAAATGRVSIGVAALALVLILSVLWRRSRSDVRGHRAWPSLFFIPLWILGIPLLLLSVPLLLVERVKSNLPTDPRVAQLNADEATLRTATAGGDAELSRMVLDVLKTIAVEEAKMGDARVFSRVRGDAVLVLVQMPTLKKFEDSARDELLTAVTDIVSARPDLADKRLYVGVKGRLTYGAIQTPDGGTKTGAVLLSKLLLDFYGPASTPATSPATSASTAPAAATLPASTRELEPEEPERNPRPSTPQ